MPAERHQQFKDNDGERLNFLSPFSLVRNVHDFLFDLNFFWDALIKTLFIIYRRSANHNSQISDMNVKRLC